MIDFSLTFLKFTTFFSSLKHSEKIICDNQSTAFEFISKHFPQEHMISVDML